MKASSTNAERFTDIDVPTTMQDSVDTVPRIRHSEFDERSLPNRRLDRIDTAPPIVAISETESIWKDASADPDKAEAMLRTPPTHASCKTWQSREIATESSDSKNPPIERESHNMTGAVSSASPPVKDPVIHNRSPRYASSSTETELPRNTKSPTETAAFRHVSCATDIAPLTRQSDQTARLPATRVSLSTDKLSHAAKQPATAASLPNMPVDLADNASPRMQMSPTEAAPEINMSFLISADSDTWRTSPTDNVAATLTPLSTDMEPCIIPYPSTDTLPPLRTDSDTESSPAPKK